MGSMDKMMDYALSTWHKPRYKLGGGRIGAEASFDSLFEDCSSWVYKCAKKGGFIPESMWNGSTEDLFKLARQGKYLKEIPYSEVRRGDIFVKGKEGASGGAYGHTGLFTRKGEIIHCNYGNGTVTTNNEKEGYWYYLDNKYYPVRFFRWVGAENDSPKPKKKDETKKTTSPSVVAGARKVKNEKWHGLTTTYCNVRSGPSTASPVVAQYRPHEVINYDEVWEGNGYRWISYIGKSSGKRRWVAYRRTSGNTRSWIKF